MKILVEMKDGERQLITIVPPVTKVHDGEALSFLRCGDGTEHWFTPDGYYDGWGRAVNMSFEEAQVEIARKESEQQAPAPVEEK